MKEPIRQPSPRPPGRSNQLISLPFRRSAASPRSAGLATLSALALCISALFAGTTHAHHSFAAEFDYDLTGTIEGEVIEVLFVNPHARYFVAVTDEEGNEVIWDAQTRSTSALTRAGWSKDTIMLGEHVTLEGNLGRDNTRKIWIRELIKENGDVIYPTGEPEPGEPEENVR